MHIAIIGAGICGLLTALELVEQGCSVDIFDQQQAGQAASWAGGGILSPMYPWRYAPEVNQLAQYGKFQQAIYFPQLANIRNPRLLQSLIQYLKQHPLVRFFEHCPIEKLITQHDQVQGIQSKNGQQFFADHVVLASGAWSQYWAAETQSKIPVQPIQGQMLLFKATKDWLPTMCMNRVMYLIPRLDGHIVCGSSMAECGFNAAVDEQTQQYILSACLEMVPELAQFPIVKRWAGLRPSSPHGIPYIGAMPNMQNLWANFGHFRNGLCMAPASAQLLRQMILRQPTLLDPAAYSPQRLQSLL